MFLKKFPLTQKKAQTAQAFLRLKKRSIWNIICS